MYVGEQIKKFRKKRNMTQRELAAQVGVATGTIQQYELGKREPRVAILQKIAIALGVPLEELVGLETFDSGEAFQERWKGIQEAARQKPENELTVVRRASPDQRLKAAWNRLNNDGKEAAASRVEEVAEVPRYQADNKAP